MNYEENIMGCVCSDYIKEEMNALENLDNEKINEVFTSIMSAYETGGRVFLMGNGGSAANASHWVNDIKKNMKNVNNGFEIICLTDNIPIFTAYANDIAYEDVFLEQIKGRIRVGDILIALSVSGSSKNLVHAFQYAKKVDCKTISIIGDYGGILENYSDIAIVIQSKKYGIAEDIQQTINHILVEKIKEQYRVSEREENSFEVCCKSTLTS